MVRVGSAWIVPSECWIYVYRSRILCTLYGAVDFLIVPSKGLYGWGGRSRAIKFLYAPAPLLPTVRALWAEFFGPKWYSPIGLMPFRMTQKTRPTGPLLWEVGEQVHKGTLRCIKELPHPYRPLDWTIKESTAPYKVHNIRLRYIKYVHKNICNIFMKGIV